MRLIQHHFCRLVRWMWNHTAYQQINYEWEQVFTNMIDGSLVSKDQVQTMARAWESYFNSNDVALEVPLRQEYWQVLEGTSDFINELPPRERMALIITLMDDLVGEVYNDTCMEVDT